MEEPIKAVFFDIDDTLYDSTLQARQARRNAVVAMIEAGLEIPEEEAEVKLKQVVEKFGSNYPQHFNELLREHGYEPNPRIIAAGVVAYHTTKIAYLVPFPDTIPTLLKLRDRGFKLGIITDGLAVKQWEKLIRLGLQHFFHCVMISGDAGTGKPDPGFFVKAVEGIGCASEESLMVGDRLDKDIKGANAAGVKTAQIMRGKYRELKPKDPSEEPDYVVSKLSEILKLL